MGGETFLWLIRHAPVDGVAGTIHAADAPADLGARAQLEALRQRLPRDAASYASPSRRTVETARALGLEPLQLDEFSEQDFGDWTGRRHDELAATGGEAYARFWSDPARGRPSGGESFEEQVARVRLGLSKIGTGGRNARRAFRHDPGGAVHRARPDATSGPALRDRSAVADQD
ncbi:alpha-ribazole phosphatase [Bradyrhizobium sp. GM0.4]